MLNAAAGKYLLHVCRMSAFTPTFATSVLGAQSLRVVLERQECFRLCSFVGLHKSGYHHRTSLDSPNKICTLYAFATLPQYTFVKLNISYATSPVRGCQFAPDMPDVEYEK